MWFAFFITRVAGLSQRGWELTTLFGPEQLGVSSNPIDEEKELNAFGHENPAKLKPKNLPGRPHIDKNQQEKLYLQHSKSMANIMPCPGFLMRHPNLIHMLEYRGPWGKSLKVQYR